MKRSTNQTFKTCTGIMLSLTFVFSSLVIQAQVTRKRTTVLMGSKFEIICIGTDSLSAERNINSVIAEVSRIENLISDWIPVTQVSRINLKAGIEPVKVDHELFELTKRAIKLSEQTGGAFDISFAAMEKIWKFDGTMSQIPDAEDIRKSVAKVGYQNILLDSTNSTIFLKLPGMKIGFGSIGKGYAADQGRTILMKLGVQGGIVNASGDISAWGKQLDGTPWNIGITNPFKPQKLVGMVPLQESAITTSGNYENYVEIGGKRFSHIINPITGYPVSGLSSVTIHGPSAEVANGLSTSIMVMGKKDGLQLLKEFPEYWGILITDSGKVIQSAKSSNIFSSGHQMIKMKPFSGRN